MALPDSGAISMSQVRTELGTSGAISLGSSAVRNLAGIPSGSISMSQLRGKNSYSGKIITMTIETFNSGDTAWLYMNYNYPPLPAPYEFFTIYSIWSGDAQEKANFGIANPDSGLEMPIKKPSTAYIKVDDAPAQITSNIFKEPSATAYIAEFANYLGGDPKVSTKTVQIGFTF